MSFTDCIESSGNCKSTIDVISIQHKTQKTFTHIIKDSNDDPVDLTPYTAAPAPDTYTGAQIVVRDRFDNRSTAYLSEIAITDAANGEVTLSFEMGDFENPGMYLAVIDLLIDDQVQVFYSYYLAVDPGLDTTSCGPITIAEIRLALRDSCPEANTLLDEYEFTDSEIAFCIRRPIDYWNGCLPPLPPVSVANFPFRFEWLNATIGELLVIAGRQYMRNKLAYSAGGTSVNDKDKDQPYITIGQKMIDTFKVFAQQRKVAINMTGAFGTINSDFGGNAWTGYYFY